MSRNKKAKHDASDLAALSRTAVQGAKARRARVLEQAELEEAVGGKMGAGGAVTGTKGPLIGTQTEGFVPRDPDVLRDLLERKGIEMI